MKISMGEFAFNSDVIAKSAEKESGEFLFWPRFYWSSLLIKDLYKSGSHADMIAGWKWSLKLDPLFSVNHFYWWYHLRPLLLIVLFTYDFLPWFLIGCRLYSQRSITQFELLSVASITIWILLVTRPLGNNNMKHTAYIRLLISIFSRKQSTELLLKEPWCHLRMLGVDKKTTLELDYTGHILVEKETI